MITPQQPRSRLTLRRFHEAGRKLFARSPIVEVTVPALAREARSSVGAFYARFKDKDEFLAAFYEEWCADGRTRLEGELSPERWKNLSARAMIQGIMRLRAAYYIEHRSLIRNLLLHVRQAKDERFVTAARQVTDEAAGRFQALLPGRRDLKAIPADEDVRRALIISDAPLREWLLFGRGSTVTSVADEEPFIDDVAFALWTLLTTPHYRRK